MAVNWSDVLRESENRAVNAAVASLQNEGALQAAQRSGTVNVVGSNANPDAEPHLTLRCDTVKVADGVLR